MDYVMKCETMKIIITPYVLAKISDDFYKAAESYKQKDFSLAKYSMYLSSMERGLKAAILSKECTPEKKSFLRKTVCHDLKVTIKEFEALFSSIFSLEDKKSLEKVNSLYLKKGFDYFSDEMLLELANGYKNLPKLEVVEKISQKVNLFVAENKYFNN
ncbi:MAG: hypothetical protein Q8Q48_00930 [Candidatus Staskawiczbacteria bacterium]|nr:hypothetical protein [Candidatus Staskawiczbacteria bacterium]